MELTDSCTFDDVVNAMELSLHEFGEGGDSDTDSDEDDDKPLTRGDLKRAKELGGAPIYFDQDARRPVTENVKLLTESTELIGAAEVQLQSDLIR